MHIYSRISSETSYFRDIATDQRSSGTQTRDEGTGARTGGGSDFATQC